MTTLGIISDTHGLLRPEAIEALQGVDHILHAGDVGKPEVLEALWEIAPVTAVRGNVDKGPWAEQLPLTEAFEFSGYTLYMVHILDDLDIDPVAAGFQAVIYGHSHKPSMTWKEGVMYLNPGSAGPRRFSLPVSLARVYLHRGKLQAEILDVPV